MKLKHFFYSIACLISVVSFASCNSDNEYVIDGEQSPEGRIISFSVDASPYTAMDTITYPALKPTKFTIQNRGGYEIFNNDSLPVDISIRSLKLNLEYANKTHAKTDLVYPKDSTEYPKEWNETDSVKFFKIKDTYYPQLKVIAPNGHERIYSITFNIHEQDPDAITWHNNAAFKLKEQGETKVVLNADKSKFIAFTNDKSKVYRYTSLVETTAWLESQSEATTNLPNTTLVKSLHTTDAFYVVITSDGLAYTSPIEDGISWTKHDKFKIQSIVGLLPEIPSKKTSPLNEFLITYLDDANTLVYAKTSDFETLLGIKLSSRNNNLVINGFPTKKYSSLQRTTNNEDYIITVGGTDSNNALVQKSWMIKNVSLGDATKNIPAEISIYPSATTNIVPFKTQVTSFLYDDMIYAVSGDSLSLYTSRTGDAWAIADKKQKLDAKMTGMNLPSVAVDKEDNMWIFGGVSNGDTPAYSQQIWRGKINRLSHKN